MEVLIKVGMGFRIELSKVISKLIIIWVKSEDFVE